MLAAIFQFSPMRVSAAAAFEFPVCFKAPGA